MRQTSLLRQRRAYSLVECIAAIALMTMAMHLVISLLYTLNNWDKTSHQAIDRAAACDRLDYALRKVLAQATAVEANQQQLTITTPQGRSEWRLDRDACLLQAKRGDDTVLDRYTIGPYTEWQLAESPRRWDLTLVGSESPAPTPVRILASRSPNEGGQP